MKIDAAFRAVEGLRWSEYEALIAIHINQDKEVMLSQRLWGIAPFHKIQTLDLPISAATVRERLLTALDGNWTIDGGMRYTRMMSYRDIQHYSGVVMGNSFHLIGPMGFGKIPMQIDGELQAHGTKSRLQIIVHTSLFASLRKMFRTIVVMLCLGLLGASLLWFYGVDITSLKSMTLVAFIVLAMFLSVGYMTLIKELHSETRLFLNWLHSQVYGPKSVNLFASEDFLMEPGKR